MILLTVTCYLIFTALLLRQRLIPHRAKKFSEDLLIFKLETVKRYYPELRDLSYLDIVQQYDLEEAYNNIKIL